MKKAFFLLLITTFGLTGCAELSQFVTLKPNNSSSGGYDYISSGVPVADKEIKETLVIKVDVDTAAARIKRYYGFSSLDEVQGLQNSGRNSDKWRASAVTSEGYAWDAMPGSYYKMGSNWSNSDNANDSLLIEIEKDGKGSHIYLTYRSNLASHTTKAYVGELFSNIKKVAENKKR